MHFTMTFKWLDFINLLDLIPHPFPPNWNDKATLGTASVPQNTEEETHYANLFSPTRLSFHAQSKPTVAKWLIHQLPLLLIAASWREVKKTNQNLPGCHWLALCQNVIHPEHNRVIAPTNLPSGAPPLTPWRGWRISFAAGHWVKKKTCQQEVKATCSFFKRPSGIKLNLGTRTQDPLIPQKQAWEGADIECTFFLTLHTIVPGQTMWYLTESGGGTGNHEPPVAVWRDEGSGFKRHAGLASEEG